MGIDCDTEMSFIKCTLELHFLHEKHVNCGLIGKLCLFIFSNIFIKKDLHSTYNIV